MSHEIRIAGTDVRFECREGQTLLDAAVHAGIEMPYKIELRYPQSETADKQAAALQETWNEAGFEVTLSPRIPSPRVAPRTRRPSVYVRAMLRPSILSSAT